MNFVINFLCLLSLVPTFSSQGDNGESCNATLWKELVDPLLAIYTEAVMGLPHILVAIDVELDYLEGKFKNSSETRQEVLKSKANDLCNLDIDGDQNLQFVCVPANDSDDPHLGSCQCSTLWQRIVFSQFDPVKSVLTCYAVPGVTKCRRFPSFLRHFRGWLECFPGAECVEDVEDRRLKIGGDADYEYAYGYCTCKNTKENADCLELQRMYAPGLDRGHKVNDLAVFNVAITVLALLVS